MKKTIILFFAYASVFVGCDKTIDFNGEKTEPETIVNGLITPDSTIDLSISMTKHITEIGDIEKVTDALLELYSNGSLIETMIHKEDGNYQSSIKPDIGKTYEFRLIQNEEAITAKSSIPQAVKLQDVTNTTIEYNGGEYDGAEIEITINFTDPAEQQNYYRFSVHPEPLDFEGLVIWDDGSWITSDDAVFKSTFGSGNGLDGSPPNRYAIFSDNLINGKNYSLTFRLTDIEVIQHLVETNSDVTRKYRIYLHSISEDYFLYVKSRVMEQWAREEPFSEPVPVYSNIQGGGGIFASYSLSIDSLIIHFPVDLITKDIGE